MVKIRDSNPGRKDGGYARIFDDPNIGALISELQSTSIRAGNDLEEIVQREAQSHGIAIDDLDAFLSNGNDGVYIASKYVIRASKSIQSPSAEPDFLIFQREGVVRRCFVVELKDGDTFDTKKSSGEVSSLNKFAQSVGSTLPYSTAIKVCSFNQSDKDAIVIGLKNEVAINQVWTGREFCELLGFNFDSIVEERKQDAEENKRFFIQRLLDIPEAKRIVGQVLDSNINLDPEIPYELRAALEGDDDARVIFERLLYTDKREYADYVGRVKRTSTRQRRAREIIESLITDKPH